MRHILLFFTVLIIGRSAIAQCNAGFTTSISGASVTVTASTTGQGIYHLWNFGDGHQQNGNSATNVYWASGTFNIQHFLVDSANNCMDSVTQTVQVTVPNICQASFTAQQDSFQTNLYHLVSTSTSNAGSITSYNWTLNGVSVSSTASPNLMLSTGIDTICLTVTTSTGCNSSACEVITASSSCLWSAQIYYGLQTGGTVAFQSNIVQPGFLYEWNFGDGITSNNFNPVHTYTASGTYLVKLKVTDSLNVCSDTASVMINVSLPPAPTCSVQFTSSISPDSGLTMTFVPFASDTIVSQVWTVQSASGNYFDSIAQSDPTITFPDSGYYNVCVIVSTTSGCIASWCATVDVRNTDTISGRLASIPSFPNPVSTEDIKLKLNLSETQKVILTVYNSSGIISIRKEHTAYPGNNIITIPTQRLQRGQYFVDIQYGQQRKRSTFQKL